MVRRHHVFTIEICGGVFTYAYLQVAIGAYLMDAYTVLCASALAAVVVTRSLTAAAFPLFTPSLLRARGTEWGLSIFGFLSLVCAPIPFLLYVRLLICRT
jgi:hypothetical protein